MVEPASDVWLLCSACRTNIHLRAVHWVCSVSTCNRSRTRLVFCSVACWDSHLATLRHREAWAVEARAPARREAIDGAADRPPPTAPSPSAPSASVTSHAGGAALSNHYQHDDVLVVVSKIKKYIRDRSGMNTSDAIAEELGNHVRSVCDEAIRAAVRDG